MTGELDRAYRRTGNSLLGYIRKHVSDSEEAQDILHDTFARAAQTLSVADPIENITGWLFQTARNRIVDWYRRRFRTDVSIESHESLGSVLEDSGADLDDQLIRDAMLDELGLAIDELPEAQRDVIVRQAIGGETFRSISEESGVPINTLIARKRYAMQSLQNRLQDIADLLQEIDD